MKILYHIPFRHGLGADRWIYEGFRDAFVELGHSIATFEHHERLGEKILMVSPDIIITSQNDLLLLKKNFFSVLREFRGRGGKVFARVGEDFAHDEQRARLLREKGWCDIYFTGYAPEVMKNFKELARVACVQVPFAANANTHFPVPPVEKYEADLCFVGANLPKKTRMFRKLLFPLLRKYRVLIFGPGWTLSDWVWGACGALARRAGLYEAARVLYTKRMSIPVAEERALYSSAKISLNIHEYDDKGHVLGLSNEREFKIPASGGFELSDRCPGLERFFEPGKEIAIADDSRDWFSKIDYYLTHKEERRMIQRAGTARALRDHTYVKRAERFIELARKL